MKKIFVNYLIPFNGLDAYEAVQDQLKKAGVDGEWQMPHRAHVTLAYYGEVEDKQIPEIIWRVEQAVKQYPVFQMTFAGVGEFNNPDDRVIWLDPEPHDEFKALHDLVAFSDLDASSHPNYNPHVTLLTKSNDVSYGQIEVPKITLDVTKIVVCGSSEEADYEVLGVIYLKYDQKRLVRKESQEV